MPARPYTPPAAWVRSDGSWPTGPWNDRAPLYAKVTGALVARLLIAMQGKGMRETAAAAEISLSALSRLLAGQVVPDAATIAALEHALGTDLWPGRTGT
jgi:hypothetical protein